MTIDITEWSTSLYVVQRLDDKVEQRPKMAETEVEIVRQDNTVDIKLTRTDLWRTIAKDYSRSRTSLQLLLLLGTGDDAGRLTDRGC